MQKKMISLMICNIIFIFSEIAFSEALNGIDIHGFISQGYLKTDHNNYLADTEDGTFQFNEMGINFNAQVTDELRIGAQFFARDMGIDGNDEIVLDWANGDYIFTNWFGMRVGLNKVPIGFHNKNRDIDMLRTWVLLPQGNYPELIRDFMGTFKGVNVYGTIATKKMGAISYDFLFGKANADIGGGFEKAIEYAMRYLQLDVTELSSYPATFFTLSWRTPFEGLQTQLSLYSCSYLLYCLVIVLSSLGMQIAKQTY